MLSSKLAFTQNQSNYSLEIIGTPLFPQEQGKVTGDTMAIRFNIYKDKGLSSEARQQFIRQGAEVILEANEFIDGIKQKPMEYIQGSIIPLSKEIGRREISSSITVSVLIDRSGSINATDMEKIKQAVKSIVEQIPNGAVFYSWFQDTVSSSVPLNRSNFEQANFSTSKYNTDLNNAIYMKLLEFDSSSVIPNESLEQNYKRNKEVAGRKTLNNYLIVLTDGADDIRRIMKYEDPKYEIIPEPKLYNVLHQYSSKVKVYVLGFGDSTSFFNEEKLKNIVKANSNPNGFYLAKPDSVLYLFKNTIMEQLAADYEARFLTHQATIYAGEERTLQFEINQPIRATGQLTFSKGSKYVPLSVKPQNILSILLYGLIAGIVFIIIVLIIIQLLLPLLKNRIFSLKYVKHYKASSNELKKTCPYDYQEIKEGVKIVVKCGHIVHWECWKANDYKCPEFGQNCKQGKQDFFDISDPFSKKNKLFYLNWVLYGLIGGFFTWLIYVLPGQSLLFSGLSEKLVRWLSLSQLSDESVNLFVVKIAPLFIIGILMGFFLSLFFTGIEEYRKRSLLIIAKIFFRGVIGSFVGFISFLIGNILIILIGQPETSKWIDWIPWLFFGGLIGYSLTIKTTLVWKHGLFGGLFSIIFSFIVIYFTTTDTANISMLIAFMIYGAGLGASIATVRSMAEEYFIKILNGPQQGRTIAVHKWMAPKNGMMEEAYIGRSNICHIQMNWEKKSDIAEKHAKMYIHRARKTPVLVSIQKDKTTLYDERIDMVVGKEYDLKNGTTFKIGETVFQYIEKD